MSESDIRTTENAGDEGTVNPGELLAQARAKAKLSTTDVARQLKLSVGQVEALEAGQFERLPGSVFVRGFIRNYARLVKLDANHLLAAAGDRLPRPAARPEAPPSQNIPFPSTRPRRWQKYAWAAAVILVALAFYEFVVSSKEAVVTTHPAEVSQVPDPVPQPTDQALKPAEPAPKPADPTPKASVTAAKPAGTTPASVQAETAKLPNEAGAGAVTSNKTSVARDVTPVAPVSMAPTSEPAKAPVSSSTAPLPQTAPPPAPANPDEKQATLVFEDDSWVEIRDRDGKVIHWQLNPAGTRQVVRGMPPLSFVIGNAHGVRLTFDERAVDLAPYTRTDVARMTLK